MLQRILLFKWKDGTSEEDIQSALARAETLTEIPDVERVTFGRNVGGASHGFTHALVVEFSDDGALQGYLDHPRRQEYHDTVLAPIEEERIEVDVPAARTLSPDVASDWEWDRGIGEVGYGTRLPRES